MTPDQIIDRRILRRKLTFWRIAAIVVLIALLVTAFSMSNFGTALTARKQNHIALIEISGFITEDLPLIKMLENLKDEDAVKAVLVVIDSPGGSTVGGEAIFEAMRELAGAKPTVASIGTLAASAGYMIAISTDHIVARRSSIVGSIGVLIQYANAARLLDKLGVKIDAVKSAPLKAEPSPFNPTTEEERQMLAKVVNDSYAWFIDLVTERRPLTRASVEVLADGSVYTGKQALDHKLIDAIGGKETARKWLTETKKVDKELDLLEWKPDRPGNNLLYSSGFQTLFGWFGIKLAPKSARELEKLLRERVFLDGLVSVWQPSGG